MRVGFGLVGLGGLWGGRVRVEYIGTGGVRVRESVGLETGLGGSGLV